MQVHLYHGHKMVAGWLLCKWHIQSIHVLQYSYYIIAKTNITLPVKQLSVLLLSWIHMRRQPYSHAI